MSTFNQLPPLALHEIYMLLEPCDLQPINKKTLSVINCPYFQMEYAKHTTITHEKSHQLSRLQDIWSLQGINNPDFNTWLAITYIAVHKQHIHDNATDCDNATDYGIFESEYLNITHNTNLKLYRKIIKQDIATSFLNYDFCTLKHILRYAANIEIHIDLNKLKIDRTEFDDISIPEYLYDMFDDKTYNCNSATLKQYISLLTEHNFDVTAIDTLINEKEEKLNTFKSQYF